MIAVADSAVAVADNLAVEDILADNLVEPDFFAALFLEGRHHTSDSFFLPPLFFRVLYFDSG